MVSYFSGCCCRVSLAESCKHCQSVHPPTLPNTILSLHTSDQTTADTTITAELKLCLNIIYLFIINIISSIISYASGNTWKIQKI